MTVTTLTDLFIDMLKDIYYAEKKILKALPKLAKHASNEKLIKAFEKHRKTQFDQVRPDRRTVRGHLRGVPLSGKALDAFPSGHAVHIGASASAATELPSSQRNLVWGVGAILVSTRILLLAHWTSDVVAGLAMGAALERGMRFVTGFGRHRSGGL